MSIEDIDNKPKFKINIYSLTAMPESNSSINFSTAALASIPKLSVGNLYAWKVAIKMYLKMTGLYEFIKTKPDRPEDPSDRAR